MENLETRVVMTGVPPSSIVATPPILIKEIMNSAGQLIPDQQPAPDSSGLTPQQLQGAYGDNMVMFGSVQGTGAGQTIAVIDAYNNPAFQDTGTPGYVGSALFEFDKEFGLPDPPSFTVYNQEGQTTDLPGSGNPALNWGIEEALDIEWAHSMAPLANIDVVCATSPAGPGLFIGANTAATKLGASVVSMSFGLDYEYVGDGAYEQFIDNTYLAPALATNPNVTFLASTGDTGANPGDSPLFPSVSPLVVGVGGTRLDVNGTTYAGETGWSYNTPGEQPTSAGGGGISTEFPAPVYQSDNGIDLGNGFRTVPDVSSEADPGTGVWVFDPTDFGASTPWAVVGGTSLASPTWAGLIAVADQGRQVEFGLAPLDGPDQTLPALYALGSPTNDPANYATYFHDITSGFNFYNAGPGYDLVTGIGSPRANNLLPALAGFGAATGAAVTVQPPKNVIQDGHFGLAIEATTQDGTLAIGYEGTATVSLLSGPAGGVLGGTTTVDFENGVAAFSDLTLSTVSDSTPYTFQVVAGSGQTILATLTPQISTLVNQAATANVGAYYPLPLDSSLRADVASVDADANTTDDIYLVYSQEYSLGAGQLVLENTSTTVAAKKIEVISDDEFATTAPTINANQTGRVFDIVGSGGTPPSLTVVFSGITPQNAVQGLVIAGGLATDDGGLTIPSASAVGGAFLIDGGAVALSNVTLQDNEAKGTTGAQGSQGASRTAGTGGNGSTGGNSHGGAIYLAAGTLTLRDDDVTANVAMGGAGGVGGTGGPGGTFFTEGQFRFFEEEPLNGGVGGTGGQGGAGAGGALYIAGGNVSISGGNLAGNSAIGGIGGQGGKGGHAGEIPFAGGTGGVGGVAGEGQGGGIYLGGGSLVLVGSAQIDQNNAVGGIGGKGGEGGTGFESTSDTGNFGPGGDGGEGGASNVGFGGGMYVASGAVTWTSASLDENTASGGVPGAGGAAGFPKDGAPGISPASAPSGFGGGLYDVGTFTLSGADIERNSATFGGGIYSKGSLTLVNATISGNSAATDGGAVYSSGTLTVETGTLLSNNRASAAGDAGGSGGGIFANGTATITGATLSGNVAAGAGALGGAVFGPAKSTITVTDTTIENNTAIAGGGGIAAEGVLNVTDDLFESNSATGSAGNGGAIYSNPATLTISGTTTMFDGNTAADDGGAIYSNPGNLTISGAVSFVQNSATNEGGAIFGVDGAMDSTSITGASFTGNAAGSGGAIANNGTLTLSGVTLSGNTASQSGGGVLDVGSLAINQGTLISTNTALSGGGIANDGNLSIFGGDITGNSARSQGGGIFITDGTVAITGATIGENSAAAQGGGIYVSSGAVSLSAFATVENNSAASGGGIYNAGSDLSLANAFVYANTASNGGGIFNTGTMTISIVTLAGNSASSAGGAIYNAGNATVTDATLGSDSNLTTPLPGNSSVLGGGIFNQGTFTLTNTTIAENSASGKGGGVYNSAAQGGVLTAVNVTIADNNTGGGLYINSGSVSLYNTIVAGNTLSPTGPADDIGAPSGIVVAASSSNNVIGTGGSGGLINMTNGNQVNVLNLGLDPRGLANNGGPTQTIALVTTSAAIDHGSNSITGVTVPTTDERGALRGPTGLNAGLNVDVGAYEASSSYLVTTAADSLAYGTLRSAVEWANASFNDNPENLGANRAPNTIVFDTTNVFSTPQTITLSLGVLEFTSILGVPEAIDYNGSAALTISGGGQSTVFKLDSGVTTTISGLTITGGSTTGEGGGIYNDGGKLNLIDATISGNTAGTGGGLANTAAGRAYLTNSTIEDNSAGFGGGLVNDALATLTNSTISGNTAAGDGGGLYNASSGTVTVTDSTITGNSSNFGAGIWNPGTLTVTGSTISGNSAGSSGAGILNKGAATLTASTVSGNSAASDGGGIADETGGTLTLTGTTVSGNSAAMLGGGIYVSGGDLTISASTLSANQASDGGAIFNDGSASLTNATVADNSAVDGGGIDTEGTLTSVNVTVAYNSVANQGAGGGLDIAGGTADLYNTIVALNTAGGLSANDIAGTVGAGSSFDLVGQGGSGGLATTKGNELGMTSAELGLSALGSFGGPTQTISLLTGSPAIDEGSNSIAGVTVPTIDQRGAQRGPLGINAGSKVDIGAYEASSSYLVSTTSDSTRTGTLRSAASWASINVNANPSQATTPAPNTIVFGAVGTLTLSQGSISLSNQTTASSLQVVIDAPGETISGGGVSGVFTVASGVNATLEGTSAKPLTITGGNTAGDGGGIDNSGTLTLSFVDVTGNTAAFGGGVANEIGSTLSVTDSVLSANTATSSGGGLANMGATTLLHDSLTNNNAATGGGIWNSLTGNLSIVGPNNGLGGDTTISGNTATTADGGGIDNSGSITLGDSTITANTAALAGGGVDDETGGSLSATNITVADNAATTGGGIASAGTLMLINGTVAYNTVSAQGAGGGLAIQSGGIDTLYNTIIARNTNLATTKASDIALTGTGSISPVSSNNLVGTGGAGNLVNGNSGNLTGVSSSGLASGPADNGGPTETIALLAGSPAIDAGIASINGQTIPTTDQRGAVRGAAGLDAGNTPDIGAFEDSSSYLVTTTASGNDVGTIQTAVSWANSNINVNPANTTPSVANTIVFDSTGAFSTPQTISVSAPLVFDNTVTHVAIDGSSVVGLTLSGGNASGVLQIDRGTTADVYGLTISNGSATNGGAIDNSGTLDISDATISNNTATNGGAIFNEPGATLILLNSTLSDNTAGTGGALFNSAPSVSFPARGVAVLTDITIADNTATLAGGGVYDAGTLGVVSSTIALNDVATTAGGGGLAITGGTATLFDTIVAQNTGGVGLATNDIAGNVSTGSSNNLIDDGGSAGGMASGFNGNIIGLDAHLSSVGLAANGGSTETIAITALSPAVNTGAAAIANVSVPAKDQRGAVRNPASLNSGTTIDMGAYEISSTYVVTSTADTMTSGTLRTAIAWANTTPSSGFSGPNTIVFDLPAGSPQTITLSATFGTLALTNTANGIAILGPGAGELTIAGDGSSGVFSTETGAATDILSGFTITGGSAAIGGGAIANSGNLILSGVALTDNAAVDYGGAVNNNGGKLTVENSTFTDDGATGAGVGGAINNTNNGVVSVSNSTFTGGTALQGGAIANLSGTLTVTASSFMKNDGDFGGAIFNDGTATISSSTIADDQTSFNGGGIANDLAGTLTLVNDTIAFNTAGQTGGGINSVGNLTAINTTIANNSVAPGGSGGGIDVSSGNAVMYNTIVADNTAGTGKTASESDVSGSLGAASAFNMIGTGGGGGLTDGTNGNLVGVTTPDLATALANNGGPTETIALLFGSPAIDAGSNALAVSASGSPLLYDQRGLGYPRIVDGTVDIGAYERAPATTTTLTSSTNRAVFGQTVILTAKVVAAFTSANVPTGTVTFMNGANVLGSAPLINGTATFAATALPPGINVIVAVYSGDSHFANSASALLSETVSQASTASSGAATLSAATSYISTASAPVAQAIGLVSSPTVKKTHGKVSKKVVASKHAVPHGGSSTKFHLSKKTAALKQSVTRVAKHTRVKTKKK